RTEDPRLLVGRGTFVDDLAPPRGTFASFVGSSHPHARVVSIDTAAAVRSPGVVGVWTAADLPGLSGLPGLPGMSRSMLAGDVVRFVGEPVAVVVADDRAAAADAVALVEVRYEPLPAVATLAAATAAEAPVLFPGSPTGNVITDVPAEGDVAAELEACDHRATLRIVNQRCAPVPIEPTACLADWGPDGLVLWATTQAPHHLRNTLASWLDVPQTRCRVIAPDVGGGFGAKINFYPELFAAPLLSRMTGRPVKFAQTRAEAMTQMYHGRDQVHEVEVGFDDDGSIRALRLDVTQNLGAYPDITGLGLPVLTTWMAAGCYRIPAIATSYRTVVTNTTPVAAYRGAGRPEATYTIERVADLVARRTGLDPAEVRRRNFIPASEFPFATTNPAVVYDSGDFHAALTECLRLLDYDARRAEQEQQRRDDRAPLLGIGLSSWLELAGFGPNGSLEGFGHLASWESAQVRVQPDGSVIVFSGSSPHGQGHETVLAQIAADELGVSVDRISVRMGDTSTVLQGIGTMGSRGVVTAGSAVKVASARVLSQAKVIAAHLLEAAPEDMVAADDAFGVRGTADRQVGWAE
ncbi:MAG: xanthine dehydrogenase family protein molybdopterin-binding subunit, partial [Phycicoccus sp.]